MKPKLVRPILEPDPRRGYARDCRESWRDIERAENIDTLLGACILLLSGAAVVWFSGWLWRVL